MISCTIRLSFRCAACLPDAPHFRDFVEIDVALFCSRTMASTMFNEFTCCALLNAPSLLERPRILATCKSSEAFLPNAAQAISFFGIDCVNSLGRALQIPRIMLFLSSLSALLAHHSWSAFCPFQCLASTFHLACISTVPGFLCLELLASLYTNLQGPGASV